MLINKETIVGFFLTTVLVVLLLCVHNRTVHDTTSGPFILQANFTKTDGLNPHGDIRLAGMPVGTIGQQTLSPDGFQVNVQLLFPQPVLIPIDSSISIETDGLLGTKHLEIQPGGSDEFMASGDTFAYTQNSLILGELMTKMNAYLKQKKESQPPQEES